MEIKNENKFKTFFKRYGALCLVCVVTVAIALGIGLNLPAKENPNEPVDGGVTKFELPMKNSAVVKDFDDTRLQWNDALKRYEIHLALDLSSEQKEVFSVLDGVVKEVECNSLEGCVVKIEHTNGFVSVYGSLDENVKVKAGDKVTKGQQIGIASTSATNENVEGGHLHFTLLKNGEEVDPNNYLDLQNK